MISISSPSSKVGAAGGVVLPAATFGVAGDLPGIAFSPSPSKEEVEERGGGGSLTYLKPVTARSLLAGEVEVEVTGGNRPSGKSLGSAWSHRRRHTKVIKSKKAEKMNKFPGVKNHAAFCSEMSADPQTC